MSKVPPDPPPRYDEIFWRGTEELNREGGVMERPRKPALLAYLDLQWIAYADYLEAELAKAKERIVAIQGMLGNAFEEKDAELKNNELNMLRIENRKLKAKVEVLEPVYEAANSLFHPAHATLMEQDEDMRTLESEFEAARKVLEGK